MAISLNTTSKWKSRVLPSLLAYQKKNGVVPDCLTLGFAAYIKFYHGCELTEQGMTNYRDGKPYTVNDDRKVLEFFVEHKDDTLEQLAEAVCARTDWWDMDLRTVPTFLDKIKEDLARIENEGMHKAIELAAR